VKSLNRMTRIGRAIDADGDTLRLQSGSRYRNGRLKSDETINSPEAQQLGNIYAAEKIHLQAAAG